MALLQFLCFQIWQQIFSDDLGVSPEDHPVLLTESPGEPARYREKKCEVFFENLGVPQFSLATQSILALYADGRTSGVVVDIGEGHSAVVPVLQGNKDNIRIKTYKDRDQD